MRQILLTIVALLVTINSNAKDLKYISLTIPDTLKKDAYAVIRNQEMKVELISLTHSKTTITKAITVLNSKGKKKAWEYFSYNKDKTITEISARAYNALGVEVDKWNRKDWKDVSYDSYGSGYSGTRMLYLQPEENNYPYTVEYKVVYERNNTYMVDGWHPVWENNLSVEKSSFYLTVNPLVKVKYKEYNFNDSISRTGLGDNTTKWELKNMLAYKSEPYMPSLVDYLPYINVDTYEFSYSNYKGKSDTWSNFGAFIAKLNEKRDELPEERKREIDTIIKDCNTDTEKVKALYKYMQSHTRYVNISVGIGGIQTHPAEVVSKNGYGDCKALSNYMYAILKYVGIKSYFTLVKSGAYEYQFDKDYVGHQFDHAILCVPIPQDTIWLECTSQTMPCGFLGDFTNNRTVLLITENGGVLAKTSKYDKKENLLTRTATVNVIESGNCTAKIKSLYTGLEYDSKHRLAVEDKEEQLKLLYEDYDIPNFKIDNFAINAISTNKPELKEEVNLSLPNYASKSGSRLFLPVNLASKWNYVPKKVKSRKFDIHKKSEYCNTDTITYLIPNGFDIEALPEASSIESKYGIYKSEVKTADNKVVYCRYMEMNSGIYPATEYDDFISFFEEIKKGDNAIVVLKAK